MGTSDNSRKPSWQLRSKDNIKTLPALSTFWCQHDAHSDKTCVDNNLPTVWNEQTRILFTFELHWSQGWRVIFYSKNEVFR